MSKNTLNRRGFVRALGATAALSPFVGFPAIVKRRNANSLLSHAAVGCGNMAWSDLNSFVSHRDLHVTAICDVDSSYLEQAKKLCPDARIYRDAFEMFAAEGARIDSVNVSTPDHTHAQYVIEGLKRGLNVYSQKPLCTRLSDSREIIRLADERHAVTQLGTQIAARDCNRRAVKALKSGLIGEVKHIWLFSTRRGEPPKANFAWPLKEDPVPKTLEWKLWLGPAPMRPYTNGVYHPGTWRRWRQFGSSWLGDLGIHLISPIWLGLGLGEKGADSVYAQVDELDWTEAQRREYWPQMSHVTWRFPGIKASGMKPFEIEWFDGFEKSRFRLPPKFFPPAFLHDIAALTPMHDLPLQGRVVEGSEGWLFSTHYGINPVIVMKKDGRVLTNVGGGDSAPTHYHEFVNACLQGGATTSPFSISARMSEWCMTGNFAQIRPDRWLGVEELLKEELKG